MRGGCQPQLSQTCVCASEGTPHSGQGGHRELYSADGLLFITASKTTQNANKMQAVRPEVLFGSL